MTRKIDPLRRISIPQRILTTLNWETGDELVFTPDPQSQTLMLRRQVDACLRCGGQEGLLEIKKGLHLCEFCLKDLCP